jgi:predicted O-methyltransferase YrrM
MASSPPNATVASWSSTRPAIDLLRLLHPTSPYEGFDASVYPFDPQGWNGDAPLFDRLADELRPALAIEVGSWKGQSAIHLASRMRAHRGDAQLLCVDTWLGSFDWWLDPARSPRAEMRLLHGYPTLYWQFLANVVHAGLQGSIVPFPATSTIAARVLIARGVQADLVYVDASHEENDVYLDVVYYWHALRPGGVIFGDDYRADFYPGVVRAVDAFAREHALPLEVVDGQFWLLRKPAA